MRRSEILGTVADLPTRRGAEMVLSDRLRRVNSADYHPRSCCSFRAFVQEWEAQAHPTLKYATQEHYKYVVNSHLLPVFGNVQLRLISRESIQIFLAGKLKEGLSWRTLKHFRTTLGTILGTAKFWGYIEDNPVSENQTSATWATARKNGLDAGAAEFLARKAAGTVPIACLAVALDRLTNRRLLALRWQDIDLQAGFNTFPVFANQAVGRLFANLDFVCVCIIPAIPDDVVVQFPRMKVLLNLCSVRADVQIALK